MGGWYFMYLISGTSWDLKFMTLPQLQCFTNPCTMVSGPTGSVPLSSFASIVFAASQTDVWPSFGWLVLIIAIFRILTGLAYRFINYTRR